MPTRPSDTIPTWAEGGSAAVTEPDVSVRDAGFTLLQKPVRVFENWYRRTVGRWIDYFDERLASGFTYEDGERPEVTFSLCPALTNGWRLQTGATPPTYDEAGTPPNIYKVAGATPDTELWFNLSAAILPDSSFGSIGEIKSMALFAKREAALGSVNLALYRLAKDGLGPVQLVTDIDASGASYTLETQVVGEILDTADYMYMLKLTMNTSGVSADTAVFDVQVTIDKTRVE